MSTDGSFGLNGSTLDAIRAVFRKDGAVREAILYGSRAKGNFKPGSDIDLALVGPDLDADDLLRIADELDALSLPFKVDLSLLDGIENPDLLDHIRRVGAALYRAGE